MLLELLSLNASLLKLPVVWCIKIASPTAALLDYEKSCLFIFIQSSITCSTSQSLHKATSACLVLNWHSVSLLGEPSLVSSPETGGGWHNLLVSVLEMARRLLWCTTEKVMCQRTTINRWVLTAFACAFFKKAHANVKCRGNAVQCKMQCYLKCPKLSPWMGIVHIPKSVTCIENLLMIRT